MYRDSDENLRTIRTVQFPPIMLAKQNGINQSANSQSPTKSAPTEQVDKQSK